MTTSEKKILSEISNAIESGDTERTRALLLEDRSRLELTSTLGTWLHIAAEEGQLEIVKLLVEQGMEINRRASLMDCAPINLAATEGHEQVVRYLIEHGSKLDVSEPTRNPLFGAIYGRSIECVKLLLEAGIDARVRYTGQRMKNMDAIGHAEERGEKEIAALIRDFLEKRPAETEQR